MRGRMAQVDVSFADIVSHKPDGEWIDIAPMRILSFDIECVTRRRPQ